MAVQVNPNTGKVEWNWRHHKQQFSEESVKWYNKDPDRGQTLKEVFGIHKENKDGWTEYVDGLEGITDEMSEVIKASDGTSFSLEGLTEQLNKGTSTGDKFKGVLKNIGASLLSGLVNMGIGIAIDLIITGIVKLDHAAEETEKRAENMTESLKNFQDETAKGIKSIRELAGRYKELDKAMGGSIDTTKMTTAQRDEYHSTCNQIGEIMPELVKAYDSEGNAILTVKGNLEELTEAYKKNRVTKARAFLVNGNENGNTIQDILDADKNIKNGAWQGFTHGTSSKQAKRIGTDKLIEYLENFNTLSDDNFKRLVNYANDSAGTFIDGSEANKRGEGFKKGYADIVNDEKFQAYINDLLKEVKPNLDDDEDLRSFREKFQNSLDDVKSANEARVDNIQYILSQVFAASEERWDLDFETQNKILEFEGNFTSDFIDKNEINTESAIRTLNRKIIAAFKNDDTKEAISNLLSPEEIDLSKAEEYIADVQKALGVEGLADSMGLSELITDYNNALDDTSEQLGVSQEELRQFFSENSINTQEEIDKWKEIARGAETADEAKKAYLSSGIMLSDDLKAVYDYNKALKENKEILDSYENGDYKKKNGNIDHFNRPVIEWTEEEIEKQRMALKSHKDKDGKTLYDKIEVGDRSTVLSSFDEFGDNGEYRIAFTSIIDDGTGKGELLTSENLDAYINGILEKAKDEDGNVDFDKVLEFDAEGSKIDGYGKKIKNVIGDIALTAESTTEDFEALTLSWNEGEQAIYDVKAAHDKLASAAKAAGVSMSMYINKVNQEAFKDFFNLGDENTPTVLGNISTELDNVQNAYKTLLSAVKEYNKEGYLSVDTYQSILGLGSQYLQYLFDENGNLNMNAEALKKVALAHVEEIRLKAIDGAISNVEKINNEAMADTYLAAQNYQLAESYEVLAESRLNAWATTAATNGVPDTKITQILENVRSQIQNINSLSEKTGDGIDMGFGMTGESAKDAEKAAKDAEKKADDAAKAVEDAEKKIEEIQKKFDELDKKEYLENLKYTIELITQDLKAFEQELGRLDTKLNLTFESDFATKYQTIGQQFLSASRYGGEMRQELERLLATEPQTADAANELASRLENLSSEFFENEKKILEYRNTMYDTVLEFQSKYVDHINERNNAVGSIVEDSLKIMERGSLTGGFWSRSLLPSVSKDKVKQQRSENDKLIQEEERYQEAIADVRRRATEMAKTEADKEREEERAQLNEELAEAYAALEEAKQNYENAVNEAAEAANAAINSVQSTAVLASTSIIDGLNGVGEAIDNDIQKARELQDAMKFSPTFQGQTMDVGGEYKDNTGSMTATPAVGNLIDTKATYNGLPVKAMATDTMGVYRFFVQEHNGAYKEFVPDEYIRDTNDQLLNAKGGVTSGATIVNDGTGALAGREGYIGKDGKLHWFNDEKNLMFNTDDVVRVISAPNMKKIVEHTGDKYFNTPIGDLNSVTAYANGNTNVNFQTASSNSSANTADGTAKQILNDTDNAFKRLKGKVSLNGLKDIFYSTVKNSSFTKELSKQLSNSVDVSAENAKDNFADSIKGLIIQNSAWDDIPDELQNKFKELGASSENWTEWISNSDNTLQAFNLMEGSEASSWDFLNETIITLLQEYGINGKETWDAFVEENPMEALQLLIASWDALQALIQQYINDCISIATSGAEAIHAIKIESPDISQESWDALQTLIANKIQEILNVINETFGANTIDLNFSVNTSLNGNPSSNPQGVGGNSTVVNTAERFLGTPYVWGGTSPSGFDCSGLVQYSYAQNGIPLPRTSQEQARAGLPVDRGSLQAGDLVFFSNESANDHVGIYVGNGQFIHAPHTGDVVKISDLNGAWYSQHFSGARRVQAFASGTTGAKPGMAILGDEGLQKGDTKNAYPELVFSKSTGKAFLAGLNGAEMVRLGAGDTVVPYSDTQKFLSNDGSFNAYAKGTKNASSMLSTPSVKNEEPPSNVTRIDVPQGLGKYTTYMHWRSVTAKDSLQYKLRQDSGEQYSPEGFGLVNGRVVLAMTSTFGGIGDYVDVHLSDGRVLQAIIGDEKSQSYTPWDHNPANKWGHENGNVIIEYVVAPGWNKGNPSLNGASVDFVENLGNYWGNPTFSGGANGAIFFNPFAQKLQEAMQKIQTLMGTFKTNTHTSKSGVASYKSLGNQRGIYDFNTNFTAHANGTGDYHIVGENGNPEIMRDKRTGKMSVVDSPMLFDPNQYDVIGEEPTQRYLKSAHLYAKGTVDVSDKDDTEDEDNKIIELLGNINDYIEDDKKLTKEENKFSVEELTLLSRYLPQLSENQIVTADGLKEYLKEAKGEKAEVEKAIKIINEHLSKDDRLKYENFDYTTDEYKALASVISTFEDGEEISPDKFAEYLDYGKAVDDFEKWIEDELDGLLDTYTTEYVDAYMNGQKEYREWQEGFSDAFTEFAKSPTEGDYMQRYGQLATEASDKALKVIEDQTQMRIDDLKSSKDELKQQRIVAEQLYNDAPTAELQNKAIENIKAIDEALKDIDDKYASDLEQLGEQRLARYENQNLGYDSRTSFLERDVTKLDRQIDKTPDLVEKSSLMETKRQKISEQSAIAEEKRTHAHQTVMDEVYNSQDENVQKLLKLVKVEEAFDANGEFNDVHKNNIAMLNSNDELSSLIPVYNNMMNMVQAGKKIWVECTDAIDDYADALDDLDLEEAQIKIETYTDNLERLNEIDGVRKGKQDAITAAMQQQHSLAQSLREETSNINAELDANKHTEQWLDEDTRKLIFNDEDYEAELKAINSIQSQATREYNKYKSQIANLTETEWYKEQQITDEYNKRMEVLGEQLQVEKDKLAVKKKELEYNNALKERDTRIIIGGRSVQVANPDTMYNLGKERSQAQSDLNNELLKNSETEQERQSDRISQSINQEIETRNKMVELIGKMSETEQELFAATLPVIQELEVFKEALSPQNIPWLNSHSRDFRDDFVEMPELYKHGGYNQAHDYAGDYPIIEQLHQSGIIHDEVYEALTQQVENQHNWKRSTDVNTAQYPYTSNYGNVNYGTEYYGINDEAKWADIEARKQAEEYNQLAYELNHGTGTQEQLKRIEELNDNNAKDNKYIANTLDTTLFAVNEDGIVVREGQQIGLDDNTIAEIGDIALGAMKTVADSIPKEGSLALGNYTVQPKIKPGELALGNFDQYASGIKSSKKDEVAITDEEGYEFKLKPIANGKYTPLPADSMILSKTQTDALWEFTQNPNHYIHSHIKDILGSSMANIPNALTNNHTEINNTFSGDIVVTETIDNANELFSEVLQTTSNRWDVTKNMKR